MPSTTVGGDPEVDPAASEPRSGELILDAIMVATFIAAFALGYQLTPRAAAPGPRAATSSISACQLNNFMLDAPLSPLNNQALIKLSKVEDKTEGGLFLGSSQAEKPKEGVVVSAGPGSVIPETGKLVPNPLKVGALVLLSEYSGEKVDYNGDKHVFVDADAVLGWCDGEVLTPDNFNPIQDSVLLKVAEAAKETTSGIALALDNNDDSYQGQAVAVGAGKVSMQGEAIPPSISVGDNVLYAKGRGIDTTLEGKKYVVVSASDCLAKW